MNHIDPSKSSSTSPPRRKVQRAFTGLAGSPLAVVTDIPPMVPAVPAVPIPTIDRTRVVSRPDYTRDLPAVSIENWRARYADLLTPITTQELWGRKDDLSERDHAVLRRVVGGDDRSIGQVQIVRDSGDLRKVPAWMNNQTAVKEFLLAHFPHLVTDDKQRQTASLWYFIIDHLKRWETARQIARKWNAIIVNQLEERRDWTNMLAEEGDQEALLDELLRDDGTPTRELSAALVRSTLQKIMAVAGGLRTDGKPRNGRRGRPKHKL